MSLDAAYRSDPSPLSALPDTCERGGQSQGVESPDHEVIGRFHTLYYAAADRGGTWANTFWMGVRVLKCPLDLWIYQEILFEVKPELIIECGTADGGTTLFLAHLCDMIGRGEVVSIDVRTSPRRRRHPRISYWLGSSTEEWIVESARRKASGRSPVLVILDSNHSAEHVLQELRLYGSLVTPGSYLIVEDTNVNGNPICPGHGPGPTEAVQVFLREEPSFSVDTAREKFYLTFNPSGYLRKQIPGPGHAHHVLPTPGGGQGRNTGATAAWAAFWTRWACAAVSHRTRSRLRALALVAMDYLSQQREERSRRGPGAGTALDE